MSQKQPPLFADWAKTYLQHCKGNREKPSSLASKESILMHHLIPALGSLPVDQIGVKEYGVIKGLLSDKAPKTVNNILAVLGSVLSLAHQWEYREPAPVNNMLPVFPTEMASYTAEEYTRLRIAAKQLGPDSLVLILLGGDAGLRPGEVRALSWPNVNVGRKLITVRHSEWNGIITTPKHSKIREVPMTERLAIALSRLPGSHRSGLVLPRDREKIGTLMTPRFHRCWLKRIQQRADVPTYGPHTLRHTCFSLLAERGAPVTVIQQLAGHGELRTTQRYMHTNPEGLQAAVRLLENPEGGEN